MATHDMAHSSAIDQFDGTIGSFPKLRLQMIDCAANSQNERDINGLTGLLLTTEEGRGPHGILILKKVNDTFKNVRVKLLVEID